MWLVFKKDYIELTYVNSSEHKKQQVLWLLSQLHDIRVIKESSAECTFPFWTRINFDDEQVQKAPRRLVDGGVVWCSSVPNLGLI